jgi:hypothetical protein
VVCEVPWFTVLTGNVPENGVDASRNGLVPHDAGSCIAKVGPRPIAGPRPRCEAFRVRTHSDGLDETVVANALGKLLKLGFVKGAPWVSSGLMDGVDDIGERCALGLAHIEDIRRTKANEYGLILLGDVLLGLAVLLRLGVLIRLAVLLSPRCPSFSESRSWARMRMPFCPLMTLRPS